LVEASVSLTFLTLWLVDVVGPGEMLATYVRLGVFGLDALLMCTLICAALIAVDDQAIPWRLTIPAVVALALAAGLAPYLIDHLQRHQFELKPLGAIAVGVLVGSALGSFAVGFGRSLSQRRSPLIAGTLTGAYLSWAAVSLIASVTAVLFLLTRQFRGRSAAARWSLIFTAVTLLLLVCNPFISGILPREPLWIRLWIAMGGIALTVIAGRFGRD
jgi:hypothetical protein